MKFNKLLLTSAIIYTRTESCNPFIYTMATSDPLVHMLRPFDPEEDPSTVCMRWEKWLSRFETYLVAKNITDGNRCLAHLLLLGGAKVYDF